MHSYQAFYAVNETRTSDAHRRLTCKRRCSPNLRANALARKYIPRASAFPTTDSAGHVMTEGHPMAFFAEFKAFIQRGSVIDLAVGVIIGAAFGKIVTSLVGDILMPLIGILTQGINIAGLSYEMPNPADPTKVLVTLKYGSFLQSGIDFLIIAFCVFLLVKAVNALHKKEEPQPPPQEKLLAEIRDLLKEGRNANPH
jgi:large conductance mechanosensitive channel